MGKKVEKVIILMSTYNGEKYLREQLDSIFAQEGVEVNVLVRDDGSTDQTLPILKEYEKKRALQFYTGENLKPARSFMDLIYKAPDARFYAFCDQDDVWAKSKLQNALSQIEKYEKPVLYYHAMNIVDENLNKYDFYFRQEAMAKSLKYSALFGDEIAGCTMVFNKQLINAVRKYHPSFITMHDGWLHRVCLAVDGEIVGDSTPYIEYRQHAGNAVGMRKKNFFRKLKKIRKNDQRFSKLALEMLNGYADTINENDKKFLMVLAEHKNLKSKCYIIKVALSICSDRNLLNNLVIKLLCNLF